MKSKSIILIAVSLGFGCIAAIGMVQVMAKNKNAGPKVNTVPVLVALADLEINQELTEENAKLERWPESMVPEGVVGSWEDAEACRVSGRVIKGFPIMSEMLLQPGEFSGLTIRKGHRIFALKASNESGFGGLLKPGDLVDVIGTFKESGDKGEGEVAKTILTSVRVFAVNDQTSRTPGEEGESQKVSLIQLEVTPAEAEQLALVENKGDIRLLLTNEEKGEGDEIEEASAEELAELVSSDESDQSESIENIEVASSSIANAAELIAGIFGALGQQRAAASDARRFTPHTMTMVTADGVKVYHWRDRQGPPTTPAESTGFGVPSGYTPPTVPDFGGKSGSNAGEGSDSTDASDYAAEEDNEDW